MYTKSDICVSTFVRRIICGISGLFFLQCIFVFANLIHYAFLKISQHFPHYYTREGGRAYGGPPRGYLQEIYCLQVCRGRREGRGVTRRECGVKSPITSSVCPRSTSAGPAVRSE